MANVRREDEAAFAELRDAVARYCECEVPSNTNPNPARCKVCLQLTDQKALDHLMFAHTLAVQMQAEEEERNSSNGGTVHHGSE